MSFTVFGKTGLTKRLHAPSYEKQSTDGFGIREHPKYGTVIDMTNLVLGHSRLSFIIDQ